MNTYNEYVECPSTRKVSSKKQRQIILAVSNWIVETTKSNLTNVSLYSENLETFRKKLVAAMEKSYATIHCINFRTTRPDTDLFELAYDCGIPASSLPQNISIIANNQKAFYFTRNSAKKIFIYE